MTDTAAPSPISKLATDFVGNVNPHSLTTRKGFNPRRKRDAEADKAFAADVESRGVIQSITIGREKKGDPWFVVAGHRRFEAAILGKLSEVPVVGYTAPIAVLSEMAIVENIAREDLSTYDLALAIDGLKEANPALTQAEIAVKFSSINGKAYSRATVGFYSNALRALSDRCKAAWSEDRLTFADLQWLVTKSKEDQDIALDAQANEGKGDEGGEEGGEEGSGKDKPRALKVRNAVEIDEAILLFKNQPIDKEALYDLTQFAAWIMRKSDKMKIAGHTFAPGVAEAKEAAKAKDKRAKAKEAKASEKAAKVKAKEAKQAAKAAAKAAKDKIKADKEIALAAKKAADKVVADKFNAEAKAKDAAKQKNMRG